MEARDLNMEATYVHSHLIFKMVAKVLWVRQIPQHGGVKSSESGTLWRQDGPDFQLKKSQRCLHQQL